MTACGANDMAVCGASSMAVCGAGVLSILGSQLLRLQVEHLAQMKTVYPEVVSLSYVNIPKTGNQGTGAHCSGIQLLIELQLTDSAAMSAKNGACVGSSSSSSSSPDALGHSRILAANSTQARAASRAGQQEGAGLIGGAKAGAGVGLGGAVHMAAILTEFERRLEKQVRNISAAVSHMCA